MNAMNEADPSVYNEMYRNDDATFDDPARSPYLPVFEAVVDRVRRFGSKRVLEVGCGSGTLARMLIDAGIEYRGFDIAEVGVEKARIRAHGAAELFVGDATDPACYSRPYDTVVCVEVLEHIAGDLAVIQRWRPASSFVCTVPNFDYPTHVRKFVRELGVRARYGELLEIAEIERVTKRIWAGGMTLRDYARRLRWNRNQPRRFAGLLGVRQFDWHGGWFLFSGTRRQGTDTGVPRASREMVSAGYSGTQPDS